MDLGWLDSEVRAAVKQFWRVRNNGKGVRTGKTLDAFLEIMRRVVIDSGLPDAKICTGKNAAQLPGFFRPHKAWDALVINKGNLIAAIEFKSQVGSIGNNFNNRTEEVLGSSIDLKVAIEENAFGLEANVFTGYLIVVEKSTKTDLTPYIYMNHFPVMEGFLLNESVRGSTYKRRDDGTYPRAKGISYLNRYDVMCKRLMLKGLYKAAAVISVPNINHSEGRYESISSETSIETFMTSLSAHCQIIASIERQKQT